MQTRTTTSPLISFNLHNNIWKKQHRKPWCDEKEDCTRKHCACSLYSKERLEGTTINGTQRNYYICVLEARRNYSKLEGTRSSKLEGNYFYFFFKTQVDHLFYSNSVVSIYPIFFVSLATKNRLIHHHSTTNHQIAPPVVPT